MSERDKRVGENESLWRSINELAPPEPGVMNVVFCECGLAGCGERLSMTAPEYELVRAHATTFVVASGHELLEFERVVKVNDRFTVVDKQGDAALVAIDTDPR